MPSLSLSPLFSLSFWFDGRPSLSGDDRDHHRPPTLSDPPPPGPGRSWEKEAAGHGLAQSRCRMATSPLEWASRSWSWPRRAARSSSWLIGRWNRKVRRVRCWIEALARYRYHLLSPPMVGVWWWSRVWWVRRAAGGPSTSGRSGRGCSPRL